VSANNSSTAKEDNVRALVAKVEAERLDSEGKLFKEHKIAYKTEGEETAYRTHRASRSEPTFQSRAGSDYWLPDMAKQYPGNSPFGGAEDANYKFYRNLMDYGARGDRRTDDIDPIKRVISNGNLVTG
jgi:hypothetical protein